MKTKYLTSSNDAARLLKRLDKLVDQAWKELNEISSNGPKSTNRRKIYDTLIDLRNQIDSSHGVVN